MAVVHEDMTHSMSFSVSLMVGVMGSLRPVSSVRAVRAVAPPLAVAAVFRAAAVAAAEDKEDTHT